MEYKTDTKCPFEVVDIDNDKLGGKTEKFNGAIIEFKGDILIAYRSYSRNDGEMKVFISKLNEDYSVDTDFSPVELVLYSKYGSKNFEDPRLFIHKGRLHCSYVNVIPNHQGGWSTVIKVARLHDDFSLDHIIWSKHIGHNLRGTEKNWIYFSHNDDLYLIYNQEKNHAFKISDNTGRVIEEYNSSPMAILIDGHLRGGSSLVEYKDKYITFYHGSDHKAWLGRTYYMGVLEFEKKVPFKITRISDPFYFGTDDNGYCGSGSKYCVFPAGAIIKDQEFHVSCGINDTYNSVFKIPFEFVEEKLRPIGEMTYIEPKYYKVQGPSIRDSNYTLVKRSGMHGSLGYYKVQDHESYMNLKAMKQSEEVSIEEYLEKMTRGV